MSNFEERLLVELQTAVNAEPVNHSGSSPRWRAPRLALAVGGAAVVAAVAVGVVLLTAGTPAAYAVTKNADGSVTVEVDSLTDASGLQAALQAAGVKAVVEYLPAGKECQQHWFTPAGHVPGASQGSEIGRTSDGATQFTISGDHPADATLVVTTQTGPNNERALGIAWAKGDVPPCQITDTPPGSGPLGGPPVDRSTDSSQG